MRVDRPGSPVAGSGQLLNQAARDRAEREASYRGRAMKLFPPICARCGREFEGKRLRELTVHHKDHNHDNNPPDGSNWELLCIYCHDNEHNRFLEYDRNGGTAAAADTTPPLTQRPFANLQALLAGKKK